MRFFAGLLLSLLLAVAYPAEARQPARVIEGTVTKVSDGDTIQVTDQLGTKVKVRMYGIDAPETEKGNKKTGKISKLGQPFGEEAYQALRQKVKLQQVRCDVYDIDKYRRLVAVVWLGSRDINREMIAEGHAWAYRKYLRGPMAADYIVAEELARRDRKGLWRQDNPQPPYEFRKALRNSGEW